MGNGTSSSNVCDAQTHNNVKNYSLKHVINAEETADHFRRSRTEEENGGKSYDDNVSIRSKDSDDTVVISERMSSYRDRGRINDGNTGENTPGDISKQNTKENEVTAWKKTLNHMDIIKRIAAENYTDPNEDIYEVDTIGYYISQDVTGNEEGHAESIDKDNNESQTTQAEKKQQLNSDSNSNKDDDRFKIVKKIYTNTHHKNRRKSAVANKQTLILAKVGTQYKYVAVPAYLPGQKLYPSKAFAKPYMERSEYLYKVKRQKGVSRIAMSIPGRTLPIYDTLIVPLLRKLLWLDLG